MATALALLAGLGVQNWRLSLHARVRARSDAMLRSISDNLPMLVGYITPDEKYVFNNRAFTHLTGKPLSEITGHKVIDVTSAESYAVCKPHVLAAMAGRQSTVDFIHQSQRGRRNMRAEFLPQFGANQSVSGVVAILTDVTGFRQIEQQLQASGQLLNNAQKIAHVGSWEYHIDSGKIVWSEETYRIFGLEPDLVHVLDFNFCITRIHPDDRARMVAAYACDMTAAHGFELEYRIIRPSCGGAVPDAAAIVNALHQKMTPKLIEMNCFVTLALYVFDAQAGSGDVERIAGDNLPIGVLLSEVYRQHVRRIGNDDQLVMYSDGISEVCSGAGGEFGADGVARWLRQSRDANLPSSAALQSLRQRLADFGGGARIVDDKTVMMVRLRPVHSPVRHMPSGRHSADYLTLPFRLDALPTLRRHIEQASAHWPREDAEAMLLAVYEAATNAIEHTPPQLHNTCLACRVTVTPAADTLTLEMYYPGAPVIVDADQEPDFSMDASGGFGLYIIRNLVDSIDYGVPLEGMVRVKLVKQAGAG